jgi:hypothetical protein
MQAAKELERVVKVAGIPRCANMLPGAHSVPILPGIVAKHDIDLVIDAAPEKPFDRCFKLTLPFGSFDPVIVVLPRDKNVTNRPFEQAQQGVRRFCHSSRCQDARRTLVPIGSEEFLGRRGAPEIPYACPESLCKLMKECRKVEGTVDDRGFILNVEKQFVFRGGKTDAWFPESLRVA